MRVAAESLETIFDKCGASLTKYFERLLALIPVLQKTTSKGQQVEASILSLLKGNSRIPVKQCLVCFSNCSFAF